MLNLLKINPRDNVAVAVESAAAGDVCQGVAAQEPIAKGFKMALTDIAKGQPVIKYGSPIGYATRDIAAGTLVHVHNLRTTLSGEVKYVYEPVDATVEPLPERFFDGYLRADGRVATRNEIWIIPTVSCVNGTIRILEREAAALVGGSLEGVVAFPHPYGCSQMGDDHKMTQRILAALADHPNAGGVLIVGLGCENNQVSQFQQVLGNYDPQRFRFLITQDFEDEVEAGMRLLGELAAHVRQARREPVPVSKLVVGLKCGGSDGLSGITANPLVGSFSDRLIAHGGSTVLTEVPEMFGAETLLMNRAKDRATFDKTVQMINDFKQYYMDHDQVIYENPSPGNKAGGISTLEDKSLGCVQKGGSAPVVDVIPYGGQVTAQGLTLLSGPGNDVISITAMTAAGAHVILFTTGRGTPLGAPVPTIKVASNSAMAAHKHNWIDFNAGPIVEGRTMADVTDDLLAFVIEVASGRVLTQSEVHGLREIALFKDGVIL